MSDAFEEDIDTKVRQVVLAYPTPRASKTHLHSSTETEYTEKLDLYPVPKDIQELTSKSLLRPDVTSLTLLRCWARTLHSLGCY